MSNENESKNAKGGRGKVVAIVVAVVVVALIVVGAIVAVNRTNAKPSSTSTVTAAQCEANVSAMSAHVETLKSTIESAKELSSVTADDVADPTVLDDLAESLKSAEAVDTSAPTCPADGNADELKATVAQVRAKSDEVRKAANGLDAAIKVVTASQKAKSAA